MPEASDVSAAHPAPVPQAAGGASLSSRAARGFAWAVGQTLFARVFGLVCQIVLAKVLLKEHFGVVAFAQSIAAFVAIVQLAGIPEILVQRQKRFSTWSNAAFWMAAMVGLGTALLVGALGPVLAWYKGNPILIPIMALVALQSILSALQVLPTATLQVHMRLRAITTLNLVQSAGAMGVSATLALLGLGAFALVLGPLVASAAVLAWGWHLTRPVVRRDMHLRRWKFLWGDSATLLAVGAINTFITQGAIFMLGLAQPEAIVGVFSWAFMLALQTVVLITGSLNVVFFPTLSKLQDDPQRMLGAFLRASRLLAMVGMPACFLQAACAQWFIDLFFKDKWDVAAPAAIILSVGLGFAILSSMPVNMLKATGRFTRLLWITISYTAVYIVAVGAAVGLGLRAEPLAHPATLVACAIALVYLVAWPIGALACIRPFKGTWAHIWSIYGPPTIASALAIGAAWFIARSVPAFLPDLHIPGFKNEVSISMDVFFRLALTCLLAAAFYIPLAWLFMRNSFDELLHRALELAGRKRHA
jgi:O-antigen/teichoic acid export membrane protein